MAGAPTIARKLELNFMGDWGWANLHRMAGWLGSQVMEAAAPGSRFAVWSTPFAAAETVHAVAGGEVDMAMSTPAHMVRNALEGRGLFARKALTNLVALGTLPQTDSLVLAIDASLGIASFDDIRKKKPALRISTQPDDGISYIGYTVHRLMEAAGLDRGTIESWGGAYVEANPPDQCAAQVRDGRANALFYEAIMTPYWRNLARDKKLTFIPYEPEVIGTLKAQYGWQTNVLPAGRLTGQDQPIEAIDWSDWLMMVRPEFPDDVAYAIAWAACNTTDIIERQYRHLPPEISPLTYPLVPKKIAATAIPLHPGAARYYREAGLI